MAGSLTILSQSHKGLVDEVHVALINVQAQQTKATCGAAANAVKELKCLTHQIKPGVLLLTEIVLKNK